MGDERVVFILGAGASHGDELLQLGPGVPSPNCAKPPLLAGFFAEDLYSSIGYTREKAEAEYGQVFDFLRRYRFPPDSQDEGGWSSLNVEDVLTSVEIHRGFYSPDFDESALLLLVRNALVRYIGRVLSLCTMGKYGGYSRRLVASLKAEDSLITFNWDLLLDQELVELRRNGGFPKQYDNLLTLARWPRHIFIDMPGPPTEGIFLKLHGSIGWFQCTNTQCPQSLELILDHDVQSSLRRATRNELFICSRCASGLTPVLVPPVVAKPISENWIVRAFWNIARETLSCATRVVLIGFSAARTDFYAAWLLRSQVGIRDGVEVFVVNLDNEPQRPGHRDFGQRMHSIFPRGYNSDYQTFSQIDQVLARVGRG